MLAGFDVDGHHFQYGAEFRRWFELAVKESHALRPSPFNQHPCGNEALHQVAVVGANVGLQQRDLLGLQRTRQLPKLAKMLGVNANDRGLLKRL